MQPKVIVCLVQAGTWQTSHFLNLLGGDLDVTMVKCHNLFCCQILNYNSKSNRRIHKEGKKSIYRHSQGV